MPLVPHVVKDEILGFNLYQAEDAPPLVTIIWKWSKTPPGTHWDIGVVADKEEREEYYVLKATNKSRNPLRLVPLFVQKDCYDNPNLDCNIQRYCKMTNHHDRKYGQMEIPADDKLQYGDHGLDLSLMNTQYGAGRFLVWDHKEGLTRKGKRASPFQRMFVVALRGLVREGKCDWAKEVGEAWWDADTSSEEHWLKTF
ncbi:hypothetical protein RQP46_003365 [Phenoliferia psychrophenolica]